MKVLSSDIGGTNARVAIVEDFKIRALKVYPTSRFSSCIDLLDTFSKEIEGPLPRYFAICAAGVLKGEMIKGTNIPWTISSPDIIERFGLSSCVLLNDFEAAAYGLLAVEDQKLIPLKRGLILKDQVRVILGAGTGLGEAILVPCEEGKWKVIRTEGGHTSFSPQEEIQIELLRFLQKRYNHVSHERILSGPGITSLYEFFLEKEREKGTHLSPKEITRKAQEGDQVAQKALYLFCKVYGQEAGNLALKALPYGGVYLSGGIVRHILPILRESEFLKGFSEKGRMKGVLDEFSIMVVDEPYLGILGGAYFLLENFTKGPTQSEMGSKF